MGLTILFFVPVVGVASIGQVHKAVLKKNGAVVAVKLQLPGMENMFRSDVQTLKTFCQLALPQHVSAFSEIEKQFLTGTLHAKIKTIIITNSDSKRVYKHVTYFAFYNTTCL